MGTTYLTDGDDLTSVANAIRAKSGGNSQLAFPAGFVSEIQAIPSGGGGSGDFTLLDTYTLSENVTYLDIDVSSYDYMQYALVINASGTGADYLYLDMNGKTNKNVLYRNGNSYAFTAIICVIKPGAIGNVQITDLTFATAATPTTGVTLRNVSDTSFASIRCRSYRSTGVINAGSTFTLYGR